MGSVNVGVIWKPDKTLVWHPIKTSEKQPGADTNKCLYPARATARLFIASCVFSKLDSGRVEYLGIWVGAALGGENGFVNYL